MILIQDYLFLWNRKIINTFLCKVVENLKFPSFHYFIIPTCKNSPTPLTSLAVEKFVACFILFDFGKFHAVMTKLCKSVSDDQSSLLAMHGKKQVFNICFCFEAKIF